ncbi:MAG TPA: immunoglobulin domain-containing protein, partial [Verrucomicrobiae bacterium]
MVASANGQDAFLAKYDPNGNFLSVIRVGGTGTDSINALAVDGASNVIVAGTFSGTLPMGTNLVSAGGSDCFVALYDPAGALQWARRLGGTNLSDAGSGVAADALGNIFVVGTFGGTATFATNMVTSAGLNDGFVAKYDSAGTLKWVRTMGGTTNDSASAVAVDGAGGVVVVGSFRNTLTIGTSNVTSSAFDDVYVVRFDANGDLIWLRQGGGSGSDFGLGVAVDASTNVYATGSIGGTAYFGSLSVTPTGGIDCFTVKYNAAGTSVWLQKGGGTSFDAGKAIAVNSSGEVLVTGYYPTTATFGTSNIVTSGTNDIFLVKYSTNGSVLWAKGTGGALADQGNALTIDPQGYVLLAGTFRTNVAFDAVTLTNATTNANGASDGFVAKLFHTRATNAPSITQQPLNQTNFVGLNSTFSVTASGTAPLFPQWFFNGSPLPGRTGLSLTMTNLAPADAGGYFLLITNLFGSVTSSVATLTVIAAVAPTITADPTNLSVSAGWTAAFSVTAGGTPPFAYQWWFNGAPTPLGNPTNRMLTITNAQAGDAGDYFVIVSNQYGAATSGVAHLAVDPVSPPVITVAPKSATNYVGYSATLSAQAVGASPLAFQWIKDGQPLPGANAASLTIGPLQTNDAGTYSVTVTNDYGLTNSAAAQLVVLPAKWLWAVRGGGIYADYGQAAAMDAAGNTCVAGYFLAQSTYGSATLTNAGGVNSANGDLFIAKHDPQGNLLWIRSDGGPGYEQVFGMALDDGGNIYVAGLYNSGAIIAGVPLGVSNASGAFVAKYDPDGKGIWAYGMRGQPSALAQRVAVDVSGNVFVTGFYQGGLVVDAATTLTGAGTNDAFVVKFNPSGQPLWARRLAGAGNDYTYGLGVDSAGNVFVGGYFTGALEAGTTNLLSKGGSDLFVAKFSPDGALAWAQRAGGYGNEYLRGLTVDGAGGVCVGGYFGGTFEFGATSFPPFISNSLVNNGFVARFDANGQPDWARRIGSSSSVQAYVAAGDSTGNTFVGGTFAANLDLGSTNLPTTFANDAFIVGYDAAGTLISAAGANTRGLFPYGLGVDPAGNAVISGWFTGTSSFDALSLTSAGGNDIFAAYRRTDRTPAPPSIITDPVGQTVFEGMRAALRVRAAGAVPLSFQWYHDAAPVPGGTNGLLTFSNAVAADAGVYTVLVSNLLGSILSTSAVLTVNPVEYPVTILTQPAGQTVALGGTAILAVDAYGAPPLSYQWQFNGNDLTGATNALLVLTALATNQAGTYRVHISNPYHALDSSNAQLAVSVILPAITSQPQPLTIGAGSNAAFSVAATGSAPLRYQWRFNGQSITGATNSALTLVGVQRANAGSYSVVVSNLAGAAGSQPAFLNVLPPPSVVRVPGSYTTSNLLYVTVQLTAQGGENGIGFSLEFDPGVIRFVSAGRASGASGTLLVNTNQAALGRVGCALSLPAEQAFLPGVLPIVVATF